MLDLKSVDMRFMYLMELSGKDIYVGDKKCKRVKIYVGRPKPRKNNRRELVNNPEDQLLDFDTVRETVFGMKKELNIDECINVKFDYEIIGGS